MDNSIRMTDYLKKKAINRLESVPADAFPREAFFMHRGRKMCIRQACKCINYKPTAQIWAAFDVGGMTHWYKIGEPIDLTKGE